MNSFIDCVKVCRSCGRVFDKGRWRKPKGNEVARAERMGRLEYTTCPDCLNVGHTAILQVRGRFDRDAVEDLIAEEVDRSVARGEVEKVFEKKGDYFFSSKKMARRVAQKLKQRGAVIKETSKVYKYDREHSVPLTKLTISASFRILPGDAVRAGGQPDLVRKVRGEWAWLDSGRKVRVKDLERVQAEVLSGIVVSQRPPLVFVKETGETVEVDSVPESRDVTLVRAEGKTWVITKQ